MSMDTEQFYELLQLIGTVQSNQRQIKEKLEEVKQQLPDVLKLDLIDHFQFKTSIDSINSHLRSIEQIYANAEGHLGIAKNVLEREIKKPLD